MTDKVVISFTHVHTERAITEISAGVSGAQARDPVRTVENGGPFAERSGTRANVRRVQDHRRARGSRPAVGWTRGASRRIGHLRQELAGGTRAVVWFAHSRSR